MIQTPLCFRSAYPVYRDRQVQENLSAEAKQNAKLEAETFFQATSERIHCISQLLRAYSLRMG